jgi:hypothetical protein
MIIHVLTASGSRYRFMPMRGSSVSMARINITQPWDEREPSLYATLPFIPTLRVGSSFTFTYAGVTYTTTPVTEVNVRAL